MRKADSLKSSTSIPYEFKVYLGSLEEANKRPPELVKWANQAFTQCLTRGKTYGEIRRWIRVQAREGGYSERQISRVLNDNKLVTS